MPIAHNLGFPHLGAARELKRATEGYWSGKVSLPDLLKTGAELRARHWRLQQDAGIDLIPSNDFSYYDRVLDTCTLVGAVPKRYGWAGGPVDIDTYFAMARGVQSGGRDVTAMEMTKWFDTNYHYLVPEFEPGQAFRLSSSKPVDDFQEAKALGIHTKPVLIGPVTFPVPTDFAALDDNLSTALEVPVAGLHLDAVRAAGGGRLDALLQAWPAGGGREGKVLSLGVIDGRNIWKADLVAVLRQLEDAQERAGAAQLWVAPSCSLQHVPIDLDLETRLDSELKGWLAFAKQKLVEVATVTRALRDGRDSVTAQLDANARALAGRRTSRRIHNPAVKQRARGVTEHDMRRTSPHAARRKKQLRLPLFPATTIGSFPQTAEVRNARKKLHDGKLAPAEYDAFIAEQITRTLKLQEELGLDVLVHGEFERNDMVEYFGEQLEGFAFTEHGWVQSYGSRYVKPPIIYGDVSRPKAMTVRWSTFAQSKTARPVKGMLTGPVTILQWSFVRDDQPRAETAKQLALAIRDEVTDLAAAGIRVIQIDEPALREGLPLRRADWPGYLEWAVNAFRLATAGVSDATQIHTHMCYSEFNDVIRVHLLDHADHVVEFTVAHVDATQIHTHMCYSEFNDVIRVIEKMDADVVSIENARSGSELLEGFKEYRYPNEIGPGVYDIHSPRVPSTAEIVQALKRMQEVLGDRQIWVNPDCGLKTRGWEETLLSLRNMVQAARQMRPVPAPTGAAS